MLDLASANKSADSLIIKKKKKRLNKIISFLNLSRKA